MRILLYILPEYNNLDELKEHYKRGGLGDVKVKKLLTEVLNKELEPIRNRRHEYEKDIPEVYHILQEGTKKAYEVAEQTLNEVKAAMKINYFDDAVACLSIRLKNITDSRIKLSRMILGIDETEKEELKKKM